MNVVVGAISPAALQREICDALEMEDIDSLSKDEWVEKIVELSRSFLNSNVNRRKENVFGAGWPRKEQAVRTQPVAAESRLTPAEAPELASGGRSLPFEENVVVAVVANNEEESEVHHQLQAGWPRKEQAVRTGR